MTKKIDKFKTLRRTAVAAGLLAVTAGAAWAESSVTLYGRVDLGVQYTRKTPNDGGRDAAVYNGGIRPSILGFKGTEDLGGGLKAVFNLEHHFAADTGVAGGGTGKFWRRQANVGLQGDFGTVLLGVQYSPAVLALLTTDPRAIKEQMSGLYAFALNQNGSGGTAGGSASNDLGIFLSNAVSYSNTIGPVQFGLAAAVDGNQAGFGGGRIYSAGASYGGASDFKASAYYQEVKNSGPGALGDNRFSRQYGAGVGIPLGPVTAKVQYIGSKVADPATAIDVSDTDTVGLGLDFAWGGMSTATIAYYYGKNDAITNDRTDTLILSNDYALSKRTILYAQLAAVRAKAGATGFTSVVSNGVVPDKTNTIFGVGISHNF